MCLQNATPLKFTQLFKMLPKNVISSFERAQNLMGDQHYSPGKIPKLPLDAQKTQNEFRKIKGFKIWLAWGGGTDST